MSLDEPKKTIAVPINMTNLCLKQHPCVTLDKCVTQNYKRKIAKCFSGVFTTLSGQTCQLSTVDLSFLRGVKLFDATTFELEW